MKRVFLSILAGAALLALIGAGASKENRAGTYNVVMDDIEACSCPLFCNCFFNTEPSNPHMCQFNNAYEFRKGSHFGNADLSGARVWVSGDLGEEALSKGVAKYGMVTFDKKTTKEQRDAIGKILAKMIPVQWTKMETREDDIEWHHDAADKADHARLGSGMAEVTLNRGNWEATKMPTVIHGLKYFGANSNDGLVLAKSTHYFHGASLKYDFKDMNGFFTTLHMQGKIEAPVQQSGRP